jgi:hypothetical protein
MLVRELTRLWRVTVTACIAAEPEAIAQAFHVGEMNLAPGFILGLVVPHGSRLYLLSPHLRAA